MNDQNKLNIQDAFLNAARKSNTPVDIHITNGYLISEAQVKSFDSYAVLIETGGKQMLVYKHAISTIAPETKLQILQES